MHGNSRAAYAAMVDNLPHRRREVWASIKYLGKATRQEVVTHSGIPINSVTGRVRELLDAGLVCECGQTQPTRKGQTPCALLRVVDAGEYVQPAAPPPKTNLHKHQNKAALLHWAEQKWHREVGGRPLDYPLRRTLDRAWREVIRFAGGNDIELVGQPHDVLRAAEKARATQAEIPL